MSQTRVTILTPPGSAAVAVLGVRGPDAWPVLRRLFRTVRGAELSTPPTGFVFGRLGRQAADEVILSAASSDSFEVHCHGGRQVVSWLLDLLCENGVPEHSADVEPGTAAAQALRRLPHARTTRTAGVLLDQVHGALDRAEATVRGGGPEADAVRSVLRRNTGVGRHLVEPWAVAIAGLPNAGKSSLLNALAGFDRSVVSPIAGTTRDAVSVSLAFDGWPVDLTDTAGLRDSADAIESEGVDRARAAMARSDLVVWVVDATGIRPGSVQVVADTLGVPADRVVVVFNKTDVVNVPLGELPDAIRVSAVTGAGLPDLIARIVGTLVPHAPAAGEPVPFTPELCDRWS